MNRKKISWAALFFGVACSFFIADQATRYLQAPTACTRVASHTGSELGRDWSCLPSGGLGAMIEAEARGVRLVSVIPGNAASKAGLIVGDRIVSIDGVSASDKSPEWMLRSLRGKIGTSVKLDIERGDGIWQRRFKMEVVRQSIDSDHSVYSRIHNGELVIKVLWFDESTASQLVEHLGQLASGRIDSVVLDLQSASYGDVDAAARCASLFLPQNTRLGYVVAPGCSGKDEATAIVTSGFAVTDQLTKVRVGPYTARAGEMLARALTHQLGLEVVGRPSAGLGALSGELIRSYGREEVGTGVQLLDDKGCPIEGNPLRPSFWSWSNLLAPLPFVN